MERCPEHDLLNCKCRETLSTFLVRQFAESISDRVERSGTWVPRDGAGRGDRRGFGPDRGGLGSKSGGQK